MNTIITTEHKETPISERYSQIEGRKYFMMARNEVWRETTQGKYNWLLANGYTVKYEDYEN